MSSVLPGWPQSKLQALASGSWNNTHVNAYITGSVFTVLEAPNTILQTVYDDSEELLQAITIDESSGKIAVSTATSVRIYRPSPNPDDPLKWALESSLDIPNPIPSHGCCISWGRDEELLIATDHISLFSTKSDPACHWSKKLPSAAKQALLSYDSAYIVTIGQTDRLTKVWRRLSYGADEIRFDLTYLRHPGVVTNVQWRPPFHVEQTTSNVLYTFCTDSTVRIWTPTDTADGQHWLLWGSVNVNSAILDEPSSKGSWFICIIDGKYFTPAVERAVRDRATDDHPADDVALDHLIAIANKTPEICLAFNTCGIMAAWALDNVGQDAANGAHVFEIVQVKSRAFKTLAGFIQSEKSVHTSIHTYFNTSDGKLQFLMHSFDGRIGCFAADAADLFSPTRNDHRLTLQNVWSGHSGSVEKIVRNFSGRAIVSRTSGGECIVWNHALAESKGPTQGLSRRCTISTSATIKRICVLRKGRFVVFLEDHRLSLWDCRFATAQMLATSTFEVSGDPLCLFALPRPNVAEFRTAHIAMVTDKCHGLVWEVTLPAYTADKPSSNANVIGIESFCAFELSIAEPLRYMLPVDPAGSSPLASGFLDIFARDVAISYTHNGRVDFWTARVDAESRSVDWLSTCYTETGMTTPALASGSMLKKAALVNSSRSQLTIWDVGGSRLEFQEDYEDHHIIQDLDWTSTPDSQSILAVGFQYRVILLCQMRFDYLNKGPAWAQIREINLRDLTPHPIGDSTWLGDGYLVTGAGNQLFVHDRRVGNTDVVLEDLRLPDRRGRSWDLFEAVQRFNGPLSVFHPQFLSQCVLSGKAVVVRNILVALQRVLKYLTPGDTVDDYLGLEITDFFSSEGSNNQMTTKGSGYLDQLGKLDDDDDDGSFSEQTASSINDTLKKIRIPQLSGHEQIQLMDMVECVALVERHRRSMDENGARFMLFFRQHALRKGRTSEIHLSWREINWAYHSNSQDILVDFVTRQSHNGLLWKNARECGLFMWLSDLSAVKAQFEIIARNEYTKSDTKNPVDCTLFYLALRKKTVLQGLWRMASGNREQAATQKLLANNFDDPKWRTAALKNAYALLGKRRFLYAAAFFLLGGSLEDAVDVCVKQLKDLQLAVAISRVYEGDNGPVLRKLLQEEVLGLAAREGDRWLASWAFWMLGRKDMAVRALITPVYTLLETPGSPDLKSRLFLTDDPALVVLYAQLRHQTLQTLRGASKVNPRVEWQFVLHSAKLYDRMGCDLLGLDLVRNWEFQMTSAAGFGGDYNPLKLLRRRSSLIVNDLPKIDIRVPNERKSATAPQQTPTTFEEPDAGSLLDSFGF